uniref:Uncharacterized protein n=1 Tax=Chenopodium quinoa TaxID=63459 RepID=A0A803N2X8_CHEQI
MAGGRVSSRSSSNSHGGLYNKTKCSCGLDAIVQTVKKGQNIVSRFYGCPKWPIFERDTTIAELEMRNKFLEDKLKIMQGQREKMEAVHQMKEELSEMRTELIKCSRNENNLFMALLFSWVFLP